MLFSYLFFRHAASHGRRFLAFAEKPAAFLLLVRPAISRADILKPRRTNYRFLAAALSAGFAVYIHTAACRLFLTALCYPITSFAFFNILAIRLAHIFHALWAALIGAHALSALSHSLGRLAASRGQIFTAFFQSKKPARFAFLKRLAPLGPFVDLPAAALFTHDTLPGARLYWGQLGRVRFWDTATRRNIIIAIQ